MFFRSFFTNSIGILTSRIFGLIRDLMTASILGANVYSDIFFVAFKIPNLFRRIFAEGAFTQAFLPYFTQSVKKGLFSGLVFVKFIFIILVLSVFVMFFAPIITKLMAFGFDEQIISLAAPLVRINFWYLLLIFIVTFLASLLHYKGHFATTAFSTALLSLSMIISLFLAKDKDASVIVYYLSFGVLIGGVLQVLTHFIALKMTNMSKVFFGGIKRYKKAKKLKFDKFYANFFHGIIGSSTAQISAFIDTLLASFLASGSISYLYYANRVFQLPLALFAIALSTSIFPRISKNIAKNDKEKATNLLKNAFWLLLFLLSFSAVGGIVLSDEIIKILFQRGSFSFDDTQKTSLVLSMYLIGLLPFGIAKIFSLWLYAHSQQKIAARISIYALVANVVFAVAFIKFFDVYGLALASSLSGFVLLVLTLKSFGMRDFLGIIYNFKLILLLLALVAEVIILYFLKDILSVYL